MAFVGDSNSRHSSQTLCLILQFKSLYLMLAFVFEQAAKYSHKLWPHSLLTARHPSGGNTRHLQFNVFLLEDICLLSTRLHKGICEPGCGDVRPFWQLSHKRYKSQHDSKDLQNTTLLAQGVLFQSGFL